MDHIVSFAKSKDVRDMFYVKSSCEKSSDLRRWRDIRKNWGRVILFFEDGTVFDDCLPGRKYFRHNHFLRTRKYKNIPLETILAYYKCKFYKWAQIAQKNGIKSLFDF